MGKENLRGKETSRTPFKLRVRYFGDPEAMRRVNPELPFTIEVDEKRLQKILTPKAKAAGLTNLYLEVNHQKDILGAPFLLLTGVQPLGTAYCDRWNTVSLDIRAINHRIGHRLLPKIKDGLGIKHPSSLQKLIEEKIQPFILLTLFPQVRYRPRFFAGNKRRLENYLNLASEGQIPLRRAEDFVNYRIKETLQNRSIPRIFNHEFQHMMDFLKDIYSEERAYAAEENFGYVKRISKAIKVVYL